jgi:hypothetical protein
MKNKKFGDFMQDTKLMILWYYKNIDEQSLNYSLSYIFQILLPFFSALGFISYSSFLPPSLSLSLLPLSLNLCIYLSIYLSVYLFSARDQTPEPGTC